MESGSPEDAQVGSEDDCVQKENGMLSFHGFLGVVCYVRSLKHIKYLHLQLRLKKAVS
jgi:hypothetical protein